MWTRAINFFAAQLAISQQQIERLTKESEKPVKIVYVLRRSSSFDLHLLRIVCNRFGFDAPGRVMGDRGASLAEGKAEVIYIRDRRGHEIFLSWVRKFRSKTLGFCAEIIDEVEADQDVVLIPVSFFAGRGPRPWPRRGVLPIDFSFLRVFELWNLIVFFVHRKALVARFDFLTVKAGTTAPELLRQLSRELYRQEKLIRGVQVTKTATVEQMVLNDERFEAELSKLAETTSASRAQLYEGARRRFKEIAATMHGGAVRVIYFVVRPVMSTVFRKIDVHGIEKLSETAQKYPTVMLPSHKSHFDYLLVGWILYHANLPMPYVAAGINLNFFPVGNFFKAAGAFFIRRKITGDILYKHVLDSYLSYLIKRGHLLAFYIEGGRTRSGSMCYPRLGLLKYLIRGWLAGGRDDIHFVPVGISYERLAEERALVREREGGTKSKESLFQLMRLKGIWKRRFGEATFSVGEPFSLKEFLSATQGDSDDVNVSLLTEDLAFAVSRRIMEQTALTESAIISAAICSFPTYRISYDALILRMCDLFRLYGLGKGIKEIESISTIDTLRVEATRLGLGSQLRDAIKDVPLGQGFGTVLERFVGAGYGHISVENNQEWLIVPKEKHLALDYYKNNIIFAFMPYALLAQAIESGGENIEEPLHYYQQLFKRFFLFEHWRIWSKSMRNNIKQLEELGWISKEGENRYVFSQVGAKRMLPSLGLLRPFLETLLAAAEALLAHEGEEVEREALLAATRSRILSPAFFEGGALTESVATSYLDFAVTAVRKRANSEEEDALEQLRVFISEQLSVVHAAQSVGN
jgi:glycerol-3-phosphate O-acyltransferase